MGATVPPSRANTCKPFHHLLWKIDNGEKQKQKTKYSPRLSPHKPLLIARHVSRSLTSHLGRVALPPFYFSLVVPVAVVRLLLFAVIWCDGTFSLVNIVSRQKLITLLDPFDYMSQRSYQEW